MKLQGKLLSALRVNFDRSHRPSSFA